MSKKLLSIVMAAAMLIGVFALSGCDLFESTGVQEIDSRLPTTLNVVGITEGSTTPEAIDAVEAAINKITVARYETRINLTLVTEDEYYKLVDDRVNEAQYLKNVDAAIAQYNKYAERVAADAQRVLASLSTAKVGKWKRASVTVSAETVATRPVYTAEETTIDEGGIISIVYPDAASPLDIMMISGKDMYDHFVDKSYLASLSALISTTGTAVSSFQKLTQYIYPTMLEELLSITGDLKAVPTNNLLAEYTYLVVNRELADKYSFNIDTVDNYADLSEFLATVKENEDITPFEEAPDPLGIFYPFGKDVAIATYYDPILGYSVEEGKSFSITNLFDIPEYTNHLALVSEYKSLGYFDKTGDGFAVAAVKGDASVGDVYGDDYYVKVIQNPFVEEASIFDGMMAVASCTSSDTRSLEIIQAFNTDPELKNLLQYGIKETNYTVNSDGLTIKRLNSDYMMDTKLTGNVYMGYPEEGQLANQWDYYKTTNLASALSPFLHYYISNRVIDAQMKEILLRTSITESLAKIDMTYDEYLEEKEQNTQRYLDKTKELKLLYADYLMDCLKADGVEERQQMLTDSDGKIYYKSSLLIAVEGTSPRDNNWYMDRIIEKEIGERYAEIITETGLNTLVQQKIASVMGVKYVDNTNPLDAYRKSAQAYYTNIAYLRIMAEILIFDKMSDEELARYDAMSDTEYEQALLAYVTETYIQDNELTEEKYAELVRNYICSEMNFTDNLGNAYTVSWDEINKSKEDAEPFIDAVEKLKTEYADLLSANSYDVNSSSATPIAVSDKIHDILYRQYLSENGVSMVEFQSSIYDELLAPYGITKAELDSLRNKNKASYDSYVSRLKSKYKSVLLDVYSLEKYKANDTNALTATEILTTILNSQIEERTNIYHTMCDRADISYSRYNECKVYLENYIKYVNMMRSKNNYTLTTVYSQSQVNRFKYDEIQQIVYDNVYDIGYYSNEMVKLVGSSLSDYMKAKTDATNYNNALKKLIDYYTDDIKTLGYDIEVFSNLDPENIEEVIFELAEKECLEGKKTLDEMLVDVSKQYIEGIATAENITEFCKNASNGLSSHLMFNAFSKTLNIALKAELAKNAGQ